MDSFEVFFLLINHAIKSKIVFYVKEKQEVTLQQLVEELAEERSLITQNMWELYNHHLIKKERCGAIEKFSLTQLGCELVEILEALKRTNLA